MYIHYHSIPNINIYFVENLGAGFLHLCELLLAAGVHFFAFLDTLAALLKLLEDRLDTEAHHNGCEYAESDEVGDEGIGMQTEIGYQVLNISGENRVEHGCELI